MYAKKKRMQVSMEIYVENGMFTVEFHEKESRYFIEAMNRATCCAEKIKKRYKNARRCSKNRRKIYTTINAADTTGRKFLIELKKNYQN